jgi:hypothetical protein
MIDYSIFYKKILKIGEDWSDGVGWDLFISAYNESERVQFVYDHIEAQKKCWISHAEYGFREDECPAGTIISNEYNEALFIKEIIERIGIADFSEKRICIDITGFMRPNLMFMILYLKHLGAKTIDCIYAEPSRYISKEKTTFSMNTINEVRQVAGFEGQHNMDINNDILIIGTGYDHDLIAQVAEDKENARKIQIYGFPSLSADMYQENILRVQKASESLDYGPGDNHPDSFFAPANDPFVTANILKKIVDDIQKDQMISNLYLCPVGTKVQALGFALYFLSEKVGTNTSIIFPFFEKYTRKTSKGYSRIWKYTVEFT